MFNEVKKHFFKNKRKSFLKNVENNQLGADNSFISNYFNIKKYYLQIEKDLEYKLSIPKKELFENVKAISNSNIYYIII